MTQTTATPTPIRTVDGVDLPLPGEYDIDAAHSHVGFSVRHAMIAKVRGSFSKFDGKITITENTAESSVEVSIDTSSIDTRDDSRDQHLSSPDFFDVENHPSMTFRSTAVEHQGGNRYTVEGSLTVRGITAAVTLDAEFAGGALDPWGQPRIGFSASAEVAREDFGLTWNQALEAGGVLVGKKVTIEIEVEGVPA